MWSVSLFIASLVVVTITHWVYRWRNPKCNGKLPPGSMGWPLVGETLQFFAPNRTWETPPFIKKRIQKYGPIFRTSFVGMKVIVSTDLELNQMVFQQEDRAFESWYPASMTKVFGDNNLTTLHGKLHRYLKNMMLNLVGPGGLKGMLIELESEAVRTIEKLASQGTSVELKAPLADMIFGVTSRKLIGYDQEKSSENLRENFDDFIKGLISVPIPIPGTSFYKCLQGRKKAMTLLKKMLEERRKNPKNANGDFFDFVIEELKQDDTVVTEAVALDMMFVLLFAPYETTSLSLSVAIKLLTEHPKVLKELTEEHEKILEKRENPESGITWEEYMSMKFTFQVINESLRIANVVPAIFRKTIADVKIKDLTIPAGWVVMVCPPAVHLDPINYKDPLDFNPSRWEKLDYKGTSKTFMAFGGGQRFCVGADFARLQIAIFLHRLVSKYRWELSKVNIVRTPGLQFPNGIHIKLFEKAKEN